MATPNDDPAMVEYYSQRAASYDTMYAGVTPEYSSPMLDDFTATVTQRRVLDLACGTGFWSEWAARSADFVLGVDIALPMLEIARSRPIPAGKAEFIHGSVYDLSGITGIFSACTAMQWFSHVPMAHYADFFTTIHTKLQPGAVVFLADNIRQANETDPLFQPPGVDDTYEVRTLADGSEHAILKNYFTPERLTAIAPPNIHNLQIKFGKTWWWMQYQLASLV